MASQTVDPGLGVEVVIPRGFHSQDRQILRLARLLPIGISAYELRYVLMRLSHVRFGLHLAERASGGSAAPWIVAGLALAALWLLREAGRGLAVRTQAPRWSTSLAGLWLVCSAVVAAGLCGHELWRELITLGHPGRSVGALASAAGSSLPPALLVGFALAASLHGARWVLHEVRSLWQPVSPRCRGVLRVCLTPVAVRPFAAPLLAGWSDRGPPTGDQPVIA